MCEKRVEKMPMSIISWVTLHQLNQFVDKSFKKHGINKNQSALLKMLEAHPGITQVKVAKLLHVSKPSVTAIMQKLESEGYIERSVDKNDQRIVNIEVTKKGKDHIEEAQEVLKKIESQIFDGFSDEEIDDLRQKFRHIIENIKGGRDDKLI